MSRYGSTRCIWPNCKHRAQRFAWCFSHWEALGEELQRKVSTAKTLEVGKVFEECREHARTTIEWRRTHVKGGSNVDTDAKAG